MALLWKVVRAHVGAGAGVTRATRSYSYYGTVPLVEGNQASDTRKISASDLRLFGYLSGDSNPIHYQGLPSADGKTNHVVVHGAYLNSLVSGVIGTKLPGPGTVVIAQTLRFPRPCLVEEEVTTTVQVNVVRKIVEVAFQCVVGVTSDNPKIVLEGNAKLIVPSSVKRQIQESKLSKSSSKD